MTVALFVQHSMRMRHIILLSVACLDLPYLSTLSQQQHDFRKKKIVTGHEMCVLIFSTTFVGNVSHPKEKSPRYYHKYTVGFIKGVLLICQILTKFEFSRQIFEKFSYIKFRENPSGGIRVFPCRYQTDKNSIKKKT